MKDPGRPLATLHGHCGCLWLGLWLREGRRESGPSRQSLLLACYRLSTPCSSGPCRRVGGGWSPGSLCWATACCPAWALGPGQALPARGHALSGGPRPAVVTPTAPRARAGVLSLGTGGLPPTPSWGGRQAARRAWSPEGADEGEQRTFGTCKTVLSPEVPCQFPAN